MPTEMVALHHLLHIHTTYNPPPPSILLLRQATHTLIPGGGVAGEGTVTYSHIGEPPRSTTVLCVWSMSCSTGAVGGQLCNSSYWKRAEWHSLTSPTQSFPASLGNQTGDLMVTILTIGTPLSHIYCTLSLSLPLFVSLPWHPSSTRSYIHNHRRWLCHLDQFQWSLGLFKSKWTLQESTACFLSPSFIFTTAQSPSSTPFLALPTKSRKREGNIKRHLWSYCSFPFWNTPVMFHVVYLVLWACFSGARDHRPQRGREGRVRGEGWGEGRRAVQGGLRVGGGGRRGSCSWHRPEKSDPRSGTGLWQ